MKLTQTLSIVLTACTLSIVAGCSSSSDSSSDMSSETQRSAELPDPHQIDIQLKTPDGEVIPNATVSFSDTTVQSNEQGIARITAPDSEPLQVTASKAGYVSQQLSVQSTPASEPMVFEAVMASAELVASGVDFSVASDSNPVSVPGRDGARVEITDNNAWITTNANGDPIPYTGPVDVYITPIDTTDLDQLAAFPGAFEGIPTSTEEIANLMSLGLEDDPSTTGSPDEVSIADASGPIMSWGMADYTFTTDSGEELNLAEGVDAVIDIPLYQQGENPPFEPLALGESIPIWVYDYDRGTWVEEATGIVTDVTVDGETTRIVRGTVTHFSPKNIDRLIRSAPTVTFSVTCEGEPRYAPDSGTIRFYRTQGGFTVSGGLRSGNLVTRAPMGRYCPSAGQTISCDKSSANLTSQCFSIPDGISRSVTLDLTARIVQ